MTELSKRLSAIASMVNPGARLADIGTDHGYLPIYVTERGICPGAFAMDVKDGPLSRAKAHVEEAGLEEKIILRKSDGLTKLQPGEADTIVMAGMGGELMVRLLEQGKNVLRKASQLLLSPQSEIPKVRKYLLKNGFEISRERIVFEEEKYYLILEASPGQISDAGAAPHSGLIENSEEIAEESWAPAELEYGRFLLRSGDPNVGAWLEREERVLNTLFEKLSDSRSVRAAERKSDVEKQIQILREAKEVYYGFMRENNGMV